MISEILSGNINLYYTSLLSKIRLSLLHMSCRDLSKIIFLNFVAIWHLVLLILFDCLNFVEYLVNPFIPDGNLSSRTQFLIMEATVVQ